MDVFLLPCFFCCINKKTKGCVEVITKYFDEFTGEQLRQLGMLKELYSEWNEKINVISRKDMDNFYEHHVLHSLVIATQFTFDAGTQVMDLGCGGGFPGIPLAIFFPDVHFHMVDSINKKLKVVQGVAEALGLKNVTVQHSRAEDITNRKFDIVVSRAVAPLKDLWHWGKPLLRKAANRKAGNGLICLKGGDLAAEIAASGCKPRIWEIEQLYMEQPFFRQKYLLYVPL
jgi:16S rRNA (guanine527-N7)-methyltransferase